LKRFGNIDNTKDIPVGKQEAPEGPHVELGAKLSKVPEIAQLQKRFNISERLAEKLSQNKSFMAAVNGNDEMLRVIEFDLPQVAVTIYGKRYATFKDAMLNKFADYPTLFDDIKVYIDEARDLMKAGEPTSKTFSALAELRAGMRKQLSARGFDADFFCNGFFSLNVYQFKELDANGIRLLKDARNGILKSLNGEGNAAVVELKMRNASQPEIHVSHSRKSVDIPGTSPNVTKPRHFDQFFVDELHRAQDSESKFFEMLYKMINDTDPAKRLDPKMIEKITLHSERPVCPSCANVIRMFKEKYGVEIVVHEGRYFRW
jgi:hypothetical protein